MEYSIHASSHTPIYRIYSPQSHQSSPLPATNALELDPPNQAVPAKPPTSAMYDDLHTNLPKDVMQFRDIPFPESTPLFPNRCQVLDYIQTIAIQEDLCRMIRFNTTVTRVDPVGERWRVASTEQACGGGTRSFEEEYDAIIVASGHYNIPYIPGFSGLTDYGKPVLHSQEYRRASDYAGKRVLVIGSGSSGCDIVRQVSKVAIKVYHCVRTHTSFSQALHDHAPGNVGLVGPISSFTRDTVECADGRTLGDVDIVVFATGYLYSYPFLPFEKDTLIVDGQTVRNLYEFMIYAPNPTLTFVGLPIRVVPMPIMQTQSTVLARLFSGRIHLPSDEILMSQSRPTNDRSTIVMGSQVEMDYVDRMSAWAEGWENREDITEWQSDDPVTGRLPATWRERRIAALQLRQDFLGY
ncbi:hypothetical protein BX666DRAFT_1854235 [Dichotomocladium elegans]|nr:hypothetical protein BX666DRAFT_1854235 [Dichotomocladium elegans]